MDVSAIMTTQVVTADPKDSLQSVAQRMADNRVSALPVVDDQQQVLGIVSEGDLMRRPEEREQKHHSWWLSLFHLPSDKTQDFLQGPGQKAEEVMTTKVISVTPDTPVADVAELLEKHHIKRVPVLDNKRLVGIVSRANLLRALATHKDDFAPRRSESDQALHDKIVRNLEEAGLPGGYFINPIVNDGTVHLWGAVEHANQVDEAESVTQSTEGVKSVVNHIGVLDPRAASLLYL